MLSSLTFKKIFHRDCNSGFRSLLLSFLSSPAGLLHLVHPCSLAQGKVCCTVSVATYDVALWRKGELESSNGGCQRLGPSPPTPNLFWLSSSSDCLSKLQTVDGYNNANINMLIRWQMFSWLFADWIVISQIILCCCDIGISNFSWLLIESTWNLSEVKFPFCRYLTI